MGAAVRLGQHERAFAESFVALVLEYMIAGGRVHSRTLFDNFEPHARALCNKRLERSCPEEVVLQPTFALLDCLSKVGVVQLTNGTASASGEQDNVTYAACDGEQGALYTLWRFFTTIDSFRRCVDRYERSQPVPSAARASQRRPSDVQAPPNPLWKLHVVEEEEQKTLAASFGPLVTVNNRRPKNDHKN